MPQEDAASAKPEEGKEEVEVKLADGRYDVSRAQSDPCTGNAAAIHAIVCNRLFTISSHTPSHGSTTLNGRRPYPPSLSDVLRSLASTYLSRSLTKGFLNLKRPISSS